MLRIIVNTSASGAKSYYSQGLTKEDYYTHEKETEIIGKWGGKGAELLKLNGTVNQKEFANLCDNINPETSEQLTLRNNDNRRVGYDINFHAPKSVSIVYALTKDEEILTAFRGAVKDTMQEMEKDMQVRVRKGGKNENRETGNLVYGEFIHTTSRPVDGVPDCHLHAHCFTFNSSFDPIEQKWKAGEFGKIKKDAGYFEAYFHSSFSDNMKAAGYEIERTKKGWEIAGIERDTIAKFSRRTSEIETTAKEKGITNAWEKDQLGAKTRKGKDKNLSANELRDTWANKLTDAEKTTVYQAKQPSGFKAAPEPASYLQKSIAHIMERKSVATEREILRESLKASYGVCKPKEIFEAYSKEQLLKTKGNNEILLTTKEAVNEERNLIQYVTESKGRFTPIAKDYKIQNEILNTEQQKAVKHMLSSKDGVIVVEGGAGTGKTTIMKELKAAVEAAGKKLIPFAPSAEASRGVLHSEGFINADTVAQLLLNKNLQAQAKNNIILIDEAGLLGNKTMNEVFKVAKEQNARIILAGDTRQHNSVERGDAMRLILEKSKVQAVRVDEIQRQKSNKTYKQVVKDIVGRKLDTAFTGLENMSAIHEIKDSAKRYYAMAKDYVDAAKHNKSVVVITPTHIEAAIATYNIRAALKAEKKLGQKEVAFETQKNLSPTEAEKKDPGYYRPGMSVQFHQNVKGIKRGGMYDVSRVETDGRVIISNGEKETALPIYEAKKFSVYERGGITLAKGDIIRITQNGFSMDEKRLNNGNNLKVKGFDSAGNIVAHTGTQQILLSKHHRNISYGYCSTSHSSQGKTVDKVIISQSSISSGAASIEQFYVSVSRGKNEIAIYTDSKQDLKQAVTTTSQRTHATDILKQKQNLAERLTSLKRDGYSKVANIINRVIIRR